MPIRFVTATVTSSTRAAAAAILCAIAILAAASPAAADTPSFDRAFGFGPPNICAASCTAATAGADSGQLAAPAATAVGGGEVYVADSANNRIAVSTVAGSFVRAFGKGVNPGGANPDVCTAACAAATAGASAGELSSPTGVAVSGTQVFVSDAGNFRVSVFTTAGAFVRAFGAGVNPGGPNANICTGACQAGSQGPGEREFSQMRGLAVAGGQVYVADEANNRIGQFTTAGELTRVFGKDVGGAGVDVCAASCQAGTASAGGEAGVLSDPTAVAVGTTTTPPPGVTEVFVSDRTDNRVSVFSTAGVFQRAFGKGVDPGGADVCTTSCQRGSAGGGAGELAGAQGVAFAAGEVYIAEALNHRISVYSRLGAFARAFGADIGIVGADICTTTCGPGTGGGASGQFAAPAGLAAFGGEVFVADATNNRVSVSTTAGDFVRAFTRDVAAPPLTCTTATGCRTGAPGFAAGQLELPNAAAFADGLVYVATAATAASACTARTARSSARSARASTRLQRTATCVRTAASRAPPAATARWRARPAWRSPAAMCTSPISSTIASAGSPPPASSSPRSAAAAARPASSPGRPRSRPATASCMSPIRATTASACSASRERSGARSARTSAAQASMSAR